MGASGPSVFTLNSAMRRRARSSMGPRRSHGPAASGASSKLRSAMFSATLMPGTQAFLSGSSGRLKARQTRISPRVAW